MAACTTFIMAFLIILKFKKVGADFGLAPNSIRNSLSGAAALLECPLLEPNAEEVYNPPYGRELP